MANEEHEHECCAQCGARHIAQHEAWVEAERKVVQLAQVNSELRTALFEKETELKDLRAQLAAATGEQRP